MNEHETVGLEPKVSRLRGAPSDQPVEFYAGLSPAGLCGAPILALSPSARVA
jgi:hypothetical protein